MQNFSRRGFQLRSASFETRLAYSGFVWLMVPAVASLLALSVGRMGVDPAGIAAFYRGGTDELSFPKTFWQLAEESHFHLFSVPVVVLILSHLLVATPVSTRVRVWLTSGLYLGALLEVAGPWAVRYLAASCAYLLLLGWGALALSMLLVVVVSLLSMWAPDGWISPWGAQPRPARGKPE